MGQGNCTVIKYPVDKNNNAVLIVDAGSSSGKPSPQDTQCIDTIGAYINDSLTNNKKFTDSHINIILTHSDKDHYCWIGKILEKVNISQNISLKINILLGGYTRNFQLTQPKLKLDDEINKLKRKQGVAIQVIDLNSTNLKVSPNIFYESYNLYPGNYHSKIQILSDLYTDSAFSVNDSSIVVRFLYGQCSAMIMGDATAVTTERILGLKIVNQANIDLQSNALVLSHHGAKTDGSNSEIWFQIINPKYYIISTSTPRNYYHPQKIILDRALKMSNISKNENKHGLTYFDDNNEKNITLQDGIYSTKDSGNITLSWDENDTEVEMRTVL